MRRRPLSLSIGALLAAMALAACQPGSTDAPASGDASTATADTPAATEAPDVTHFPNKEAFFGNLHVHTRWSFDGYINGAVAGPDEAYRWARGESVPGGGDGTPLQIKKPLDWYAVNDHAEYLGALPLMDDPDSPAGKHPLAAAITGDDPAASFNAYTELLNGISTRQNDPILGAPELMKSMWQKVVETADRHYVPGTFTTFAGFEWTSNPDWQNLHRVVIFRDSKQVPEMAFSALDSDVPEKLWEWMDSQRQAGNELLAVPHNGNASNGLMFPVEKSYGGSTLNATYAATRMRNEPVYELT